MADTKLAEVPSDLTLERPDMAYVKLTKAQPGRLEGDVMYVDILSARALVGRGDAEFYDPAKADAEEPVPIAVARGRANVQTMVVKASDLPVARAGGDATKAGVEEQVVETGTGAGTVTEVEVPTAKSTHAELVAYADGKLLGEDGAPLSRAEVESKSKRDLVAELRLG